MTPAEHFRHCPRCGAPAGAPAAGAPFSCGACGFCLFFNPAVAAAGFLFNAAGDCLFLVRAHDPAKGLLAVPGGFIDPGETAEEGLRREAREETGLEIERVEYVGSFTNRYPYRGVIYPVVDLVFRAVAVAPESARPLDGCAGLAWRRPGEVRDEELAFPSLRAGRKLL